MADNLIHFGVLGMRWGKRKSPEERAREYNKKYIERQDKKWEAMVTSQKAVSKVYNNSVDRMNTTEISRINNDPRFRGKDLNSNPKLLSAYEKAMHDAFSKVVNEEALNVMGTNFQGTKRVVATTMPDGNIIYSFEDIKHADVSGRIVFLAKKNDKGFIVSIEQVDEATIKQCDDFDENTIIHYGVLGMHWGVRRALRKVPESRVATRNGRKVVITDFGTAGKHINERPTKAQIRRAKSPIRDEVQAWFKRKQDEADRYAKIEERVLTKYDAALKQEYKRIDKMKLGKVSTFLTKLKAESANYRSSDQELAVRLAREMERQVSKNRQRKADKNAAIKTANAKNEAMWQARMKEIKALPFPQRLAAFLKADRELSRDYVNDLFAIEEKYR